MDQDHEETTEGLGLRSGQKRQFSVLGNKKGDKSGDKNGDRNGDQNGDRSGDKNNSNALRRISPEKIPSDPVFSHRVDAQSLDPQPLDLQPVIIPLEKDTRKWKVIILLQVLIIIGLAIPLGILIRRSLQIHHPIPAGTTHVAMEVNGQVIPALQGQIDPASETQKLSTGELPQESHVIYVGDSTLSTTGPKTFQSLKIREHTLGGFGNIHTIIATVQVGFFSEEACKNARGDVKNTIKAYNEDPVKFKKEAIAQLHKYFENSQLKVKSIKVEIVFEMIYNVVQKKFEVAKYDDKAPTGQAENGVSAQPNNTVNCSPAAVYPSVLRSLKERIKKRLESLKEHGRRAWRWFKGHVKKQRKQSELSKLISKQCFRLNRLAFACSIEHLEKLVGAGTKLLENNVVKEIFKIELEHAPKI